MIAILFMRVIIAIMLIVVIIAILLIVVMIAIHSMRLTSDATKYTDVQPQS